MKDGVNNHHTPSLPKRVRRVESSASVRIASASGMRHLRDPREGSCARSRDILSEPPLDVATCGAGGCHEPQAFETACLGVGGGDNAEMSLGAGFLRGGCLAVPVYVLHHVALCGTPAEHVEIIWIPHAGDAQPQSCPFSSDMASMSVSSPFPLTSAPLIERHYRSVTGLRQGGVCLGVYAVAQYVDSFGRQCYVFLSECRNAL